MLVVQSLGEEMGATSLTEKQMLKSTTKTESKCEEAGVGVARK